ncbi:MAG TPA: nucleoside/nucleotide kinase family protein [Actinotalea sp.]
MLSVDEALARAAALAAGPRRILGIAGAPGAGKSTLAARVVGALGAAAVLVPMDGFHLAQAELRRLGRADRKGAPDTFDASGFVALLERLHAQRPGPGRVGEVAYAPHFDRTLEEAVAGWVPVAAEVPLVVVEGNYLLHDDGPWSRVRPLLDEAWFVEVDDAVRVERLVARHVAFGKEPGAARRWTLGPDQSNARLVAATRGHADAVVRLDQPAPAGPA